LVRVSTQPWKLPFQKEAFTHPKWCEDSASEAIIELLLAQPGIDANLSNTNGYYPLHYAVFHGQSVQ
jgi:ankyrin repeat protein